jgi:preprotein translocase subunit SecE
VARNRKRAKERRARRPEPVASRRNDREDPPVPLGHATPDVDLAEAQLARGRPERSRDEDRGPAEDDFDDFEAEGVEPVPEAEELAAPAARAPAARVGLVTRVINFLQGSWRELQRVQWPDRRQVMQATGVVIGFVIIAGLYLGLADLVASKLIDFILK